MKLKQLTKYEDSITHWTENELDEIRVLLMQCLARKKVHGPWTKQDIENDFMRLRWLVTDMRFKFDEMLRALEP